MSSHQLPTIVIHKHPRPNENLSDGTLVGTSGVNCISTRENRRSLMTIQRRRRRRRRGASIFAILLLFSACRPNQALSSSDPSASSSRRDLLWKAPIGAVVAYGYGKLCYNTLSNIGLKHPEEHESRVRSTIAQAFSASAASLSTSSSTRDEFRVLEVGIGTECRVIRRGLYNDGLQALQDQGFVSKASLIGVDLQIPDQGTLQSAQKVLDTRETSSSISSRLQVDLQVQKQSIASRLPFDDGFFDAIICCLTLCSVDEPTLAVREMNRLLRPSGGTVGFVEHVAVNPDEPYRFLEQQQVFFDPWQQRLADNCHLHRYTEQTLRENIVSARVLQQERFLVNAMWPVSMQCCGVLQKMA